MNDESGESMEPMEEVPLTRLGESEVEKAADVLSVSGPLHAKVFRIFTPHKIHLDYEQNNMGHLVD